MELIDIKEKRRLFIIVDSVYLIPYSDPKKEKKGRSILCYKNERAAKLAMKLKGLDNKEYEVVEYKPVERNVW